EPGQGTAVRTRSRRAPCRQRPPWCNRGRPQRGAPARTLLPSLQTLTRQLALVQRPVTHGAPFSLSRCTLSTRTTPAATQVRRPRVEPLPTESPIQRRRRRRIPQKKLWVRLLWNDLGRTPLV